MLTKTNFSKKKFYQNWDFPVFFLPKSTFWSILTKFEILKNVDQNQTFTNIDQNRDFLTILSKMETFENFDQNEVFQKFRPKSTFSKILTKIEMFKIFHRNHFFNIDQNQDFRKFRQISIFTQKFWLKYIFSKNSSKAEYFRKFWP